MIEYGDIVMSFVLVEGNRFLGIFIDKDLEFLLFFLIFCGKWRVDNSERLVFVYYSIICKWEL